MESAGLAFVVLCMVVGVLLGLHDRSRKFRPEPYYDAMMRMRTAEAVALAKEIAPTVNLEVSRDFEREEDLHLLTVGYREGGYIAWSDITFERLLDWYVTLETPERMRTEARLLAEAVAAVRDVPTTNDLSKRRRG